MLILYRVFAPAVCKICRTNLPKHTLNLSQSWNRSLSTSTVVPAPASKHPTTPHSLNFVTSLILTNRNLCVSSGEKMGKQKRSVKHNENICWIDLEMTGLDPIKDHIMECACIITNSELEILDEIGPIVIHQPQEVLDNMNEWCVEHHGKSGLTQKCLESKVSLSEAEVTLQEFVSQYCPPKKCPVGGNSVGTDVVFLRQHMPNLSECLHYRIVDVSSFKEMCRRWYPSVFSRAPKKQLNHRALDDIRESIEELKYYRANMFK